MSNDELLAECKIGLGIALTSTAFDSVIKQKIRVVKSYLGGAGVSDRMLDDDLSVGAIVIGVTDIWTLTGGDIKFSPIFYVLTTQLVSRSGAIVHT